MSTEVSLVMHAKTENDSIVLYCALSHLNFQIYFCW